MFSHILLRFYVITKKSYIYFKSTSFANYMEKQYSNIKPTFEFKQSNIFSFLDIIIYREYNKFSTSAFRKPPFISVFTILANSNFILLSRKFVLRRKCPNMEFFLVCIFPYFDTFSQCWSR